MRPVTPGQIVRLCLSNGYQFDVTVVRTGKKRVTVEHAAYTSEAGHHYAATLKAYDFPRFEELRAAAERFAANRAAADASPAAK